MRSGVAPGLQQSTNIAVVAGERDQSGIRRLQPAGVYKNAVAVPVFGVRSREQPRKVEIAFAILAKHRQALRLAAILGVGEPQIAAGDRFDAGRFRSRVELDQREQVALVGQRDCRHVHARAPGDEIGDADRRVGQRIFAVHVEVDETGRHGGNRRLGVQRSRCSGCRLD